MSTQLQTFLLSLGTSLVVSLITFILGLKSGKNQTDRVKLQGFYKELYSHFSDLGESAERNRPKSWEHYKKVERGIYTTEYYPPVKEMKRTGDILFIKKDLADEALMLEMQFMEYSSKFKFVIPKIHEILISDLEIYQPGYRFNIYPGDSNNKAHFETANPSGCKRFYTKDYRNWIDKQEIIAIFNRLDTDQSVSVEFMSGDNPASYTSKLYSGGIKLDTIEYVAQLFSKLENISEFNELCQQKKELIERANKLCKKLMRKAKEPTGFWETVFGAFGDIFR